MLSFESCFAWVRNSFKKTQNRGSAVEFMLEAHACMLSVVDLVLLLAFLPLPGWQLDMAAVSLLMASQFSGVVGAPKSAIGKILVMMILCLLIKGPGNLANAMQKCVASLLRLVIVVPVHLLVVLMCPPKSRSSSATSNGVFSCPANSSRAMILRGAVSVAKAHVLPVLALPPLAFGN